MASRIAYYMVALVITIVAFFVAVSLAEAYEYDYVEWTWSWCTGLCWGAAIKAAAVYTIATAVSLAAFAGAFIMGERARHKAAD